MWHSCCLPVWEVVTAGKFGVVVTFGFGGGLEALRARLAGFGDDGVGVAAEVGELGVQGLGVGAGDVGPAEADDEVGDALVLQAADAVGGVGVGGDHVDLERAVPRAIIGALLAAEAGQLVQQAWQVGGVSPAVHPAVA